MPGLDEKPMSVVSLCVDNAGVLEINPVVFDFAVLSDCAALVVELANVVFVLAYSFVEVLCLADVSGWTICTRDLINHALRFFFRRAIFWAGHE